MRSDIHLSFLSNFNRTIELCCSNLHDYSYEAQIRKDVTFGGKINDFYDKRSIDKIAFTDQPLNAATDADLILDGYKNAVKREYESFFESFLTS